MKTFRGRENRQKGATLVEASLVFPILILIIMASLELGMLFKEYLAISALSRDAARIGALAGDDPDADCAILLGIERMAPASTLAYLATVPVEIYRADTDGSVAEGPNYAYWVGNPGDTPECNVPANPAIDTWEITAQPWMPQPCPPPPPPAIQSCRQTAVGPGVVPDIVGVRIQMEHKWITGFPPFRGSVQIDERTITRLEPKAFFPN